MRELNAWPQQVLHMLFALSFLIPSLGWIGLVKIQALGPGADQGHEAGNKAQG